MTCVLGAWIGATVGLGGCAGDAFEAKGSGGSESGGATSSGGSSAGGSTTGGSASGGTNTGGTGGVDYPVPKRQCSDTFQCVAVVDTGDPCFSGGCSAPIAASQSDLENNPCLVPWENRFDPVRAECKPSEPVTCPAGCAQEPACVTVACSSALCEIAVLYDPPECPATCEELGKQLDESVANARECTLNECSAEVTVYDRCGCPLPANHNRDEQVQVANQNYEAWLGAGCDNTIACDSCSPKTNLSACDQGSSLCVWAL